MQSEKISPYDSNLTSEQKMAIFKTLLEMVQDRGFVLDQSQSSFLLNGGQWGDINTFQKEFESNLFFDVDQGNYFQFYKNNGKEGSFLIIFILIKKLDTEASKKVNIKIKDIHDTLMLKNKVVIEPENISCILVSENKQTANNKNFHYMPYKLQKFLFDELYFNITKAVFQPKFTKLNVRQSNELKKKIPVEYLKKIEYKDPIIKYFGFQNGDIIEIERGVSTNHNLIPKELDYRIVAPKQRYKTGDKFEQ